LETPWYWYSRRYRGAKAGWEAWQGLEDKVAGKNLDLGVYRHGPSTSPGTFVTVVSLRPQGVLQARRILREIGGAEVPLGAGLSIEELEALIARRIRAVAQLAHDHPGESGTAITQHLGQGSKINPDRTFG
jgi:hypothetical protein